MFFLIFKLFVLFLFKNVQFCELDKQLHRYYSSSLEQIERGKATDRTRAVVQRSKRADHRTSPGSAWNTVA